jgi:hypothetical protein
VVRYERGDVGLVVDHEDAAPGRRRRPAHRRGPALVRRLERLTLADVR